MLHVMMLAHICIIADIYLTVATAVANNHRHSGTEHTPGTRHTAPRNAAIIWDGDHISIEASTRSRRGKRTPNCSNNLLQARPRPCPQPPISVPPLALCARPRARGAPPPVPRPRPPQPRPGARPRQWSQQRASVPRPPRQRHLQLPALPQGVQPVDQLLQLCQPAVKGIKRNNFPRRGEKV